MPFTIVSTCTLAQLSRVFWCARWTQLNSFAYLWSGGAYRAGYWTSYFFRAWITWIYIERCEQDQLWSNAGMNEGGKVPPLLTLMAPKLAANQLAPIERTQYPKEFEIVRGILNLRRSVWVVYVLGHGWTRQGSWWMYHINTYRLPVRRSWRSLISLLLFFLFHWLEAMITQARCKLEIRSLLSDKTSKPQATKNTAIVHCFCVTPRFPLKFYMPFRTQNIITSMGFRFWYVDDATSCRQ